MREDQLMLITGLRAYAVQLPLTEGSYSWNTQSFAAFESTVVVIETDEGIEGYGEICPLGPSYAPAFADGARTAMRTMAPDLIGMDPTKTDVMAFHLDAILKGHPYAKSAIDAACWDLAGKAAGVPVSTLLGGAFRDSVRLFRVITRQDPQAMVDNMIEYREQGFTHFQAKVGERLDTDLERLDALVESMDGTEVICADANTGWRQHEAIQVAAAMNHMPITMEQPCLTYDECLPVRRNLLRPMILDEVMDSTTAIRRGAADGAMDYINLKISRFGGLSGARRARDLCVDLGIVMTIEDTWGGEIATAAIAHLAASTPDGFHHQSSAFHSYHTVSIADGAPEVQTDGTMTVPTGPGLGVEPNWGALGEPIWEVR